MRDVPGERRAALQRAVWLQAFVSDVTRQTANMKHKIEHKTCDVVDSDVGGGAHEDAKACVGVRRMHYRCSCVAADVRTTGNESLYYNSDGRRLA